MKDFLFGVGESGNRVSSLVPSLHSQLPLFLQHMKKSWEWRLGTRLKVSKLHTMSTISPLLLLWLVLVSAHKAIPLSGSQSQTGVELNPSLTNPACYVRYQFIHSCVLNLRVWFANVKVWGITLTSWLR